MSIFTGTEANDTLSGTTSDDSIYGMGGDDLYLYDEGDDFFDGGDGNDTIDFSAFTSAVWVYLQYAQADVQTTDSPTLETGTLRDVAELESVENVTTTNYDDVVYGDTNDNTLIVLDGNDHYYYVGGYDEFDGGAGTDTADFSGFESAIWLDLGYDGAEAWTTDYTDTNSGTWREIANLISVENITASNWNDIVYGDAGSNEIYGLGGDDYIAGMEGDDVLYGGAGSDLVLGADGNDLLVYTASEETVASYDRYRGNVGYDALELRLTAAEFLDSGVQEDIFQYENAIAESGDAALSAGAAYLFESFNLDVTGIESLQVSVINDEALYGDTTDNTLTGTVGADIMFGADGADTLYGGNDGDVLYGDLGNDTLHGENGDDILKGGAGDDVLSGGDGADTLYGGSGSDAFMFMTGETGIDTIKDFNVTEGDKIDISDVLDGFDPLSDAIADFVRITDNGTDSTIAIDADGGADNFIDLAVIVGVTGLNDAQQLFDNGNIAVA